MERERTTVRRLRRADDAIFEHLNVGDKIETRLLSPVRNLHKYKVVHVDDMDIIFERQD